MQRNILLNFFLLLANSNDRMRMAMIAFVGVFFPFFFKLIYFKETKTILNNFLIAVDEIQLRTSKRWKAPTNARLHQDPYPKLCKLYCFLIIFVSLDRVTSPNTVSRAK